MLSQRIINDQPIAFSIDIHFLHLAVALKYNSRIFFNIKFPPSAKKSANFHSLAFSLVQCQRSFSGQNDISWACCLHIPSGGLSPCRLGSQYSETHTSLCEHHLVLKECHSLLEKGEEVGYDVTGPARRHKEKGMYRDSKKEYWGKVWGKRKQVAGGIPKFPL